MPHTAARPVVSHAHAVSHACLWLALVGVVVGAPARVWACAGGQKSLLVLSSYRRDLVVSGADEDRFLQRVRDGLDGCLDASIEYLDASDLTEARYRAIFVDYLAKKFEGRRFDLIVTLQRPALGFIESFGTRIFPSTPVFYIAGGDVPTIGTAGVLYRVDLRLLVEAALHVRPSLRRLVVVSGTTPMNAEYERAARTQFRTFQDRLQIEFLTGPTPEELEVLARGLGPDSSILMLSLGADRDGNRYVGADVVERVAAASAVPIYGAAAAWMGRGIVGGSLVDLGQVLEQSVDPLVRVLRGEPPAAVGVTRLDAHRLQFDKRQLDRHGLVESRLPLGSTVLFREPSLWDRHRTGIASAGVLLLLQTALIIGLLVQRSRRRHAEATSLALAGRLLHAQESERTRIARDLHDGVCQDVAGIAVDLAWLRQTAVLPDDMVELVTTMQNRTAGVATSLRSLSHDLHPSVLQNMGLVPALRAHCAEVERQHPVTVKFSADRDIEPTDPVVALTIFRIAQEALHNSNHHGRAGKVSVGLTRHADELRLTVIDNGAGFDVASRNGGLGLTSMEERLRLIGGRLRITARPGSGTEIRASVPVAQYRPLGQ